MSMQTPVHSRDSSVIQNAQGSHKISYHELIHHFECPSLDVSCDSGRDELLFQD